MVILVAKVMARRRKGAGGSKAASKPLAKTARKVNGVSEDRPNGSLITSMVVESEESCVSQDENQQPLSCRTPVEMCAGDPDLGEPPPVATFSLHSVTHKKFGKFRCLLENAESQQIQQNCTSLGKVEETQPETEMEEDVVIEQVEGDIGEVIIDHETVDINEAQEVVWEEQVVEETVVCEGMEIELEDTRCQDGQILEDSGDSDYSQVVEVKNNDFSNENGQVVLVREDEYNGEGLVDVGSIPHLSESLPHPILVVKDVRYDNGQEMHDTVLQVENHGVISAKEEFESEDSRGTVHGVEEYSQESRISIRGVEMEIADESGLVQTKCITYNTQEPDVNEQSSDHQTIIMQVPVIEQVSPKFYDQENKSPLRNCESNHKNNHVLQDSLSIKQKKRCKSKRIETLNNSNDVKCESSASFCVNNDNVDKVNLMLGLDGHLPLQDSVSGSEESVAVSASTEIEHHDLKEEQYQDTQDTDNSTKSCEEDMERKQPSNFRSRSGSTDTTGSESGSSCSTGVRRSSRIRSIGLQKQRIRKRSELDVTPVINETDANDNKIDMQDISGSSPSESFSGKELSNNRVSVALSSSTVSVPTITSYDVDTSKPVKVKSRWRRSSELEMVGNKYGDSDVTPPTPSISPRPIPPIVPTLSPRSVIPPMMPPSRMSLLSVPITSLPDPSVPSSVTDPRKEAEVAKREQEEKEKEERLQSFCPLLENEYLTDRSTSKEAKRMVCDCSLSKEEISRGEMGCGEDCLNRLLMIECGSRCTVGDRCINKRFQRQDYAKCEIFKTERKGFGLRTSVELPVGTFIMEYVGEVVNQKEFRRRAKDYAKDKNRHYYFMALKSDAIIDATMKGNISRFINHSCDPNAETQKWTVNGELRIGFFSKRTIAAGEEVTFDYQFQRYGKEAQRCYCDTSNCRGWIGEDPEKEKRDRKERKERELKKKREERRKDVKEFLEDMDLEEEIEKLGSSGLKNRAHTLTLCRLMVRAEDRESRVQLLKLIQEGEPACRRLFLDYHGLRLIWSWMMDIGTGISDDDQEVRVEILQTLAKLPIPNKTMLQDSKVMPVVEKWLGISASADTCPEVEKKEEQAQEEESGSDQDGSKPRNDDIVPNIDGPDEDTQQGLESEKQLVDGISDLAPGDAAALGRRGSESDEEGEDTGVDKRQIFTELASRLIGEWSSLKEVFRIPKKERLEQMKEHEREADRGYKEYLDKEGNSDSKQSYDRHWRFRNDEKRDRKRVRESPDTDRNRKGCRYEDRNLVPVPRMSKHERRQLFALKVAQEEETRRQQQEMWRQHEDQCLALGMDPNLTAAFDPQTGYPCFFDPTSGTWQSYPPQDTNSLPPPEMVPPPLYNPANPHCPHIPGMPNQNVPPPVVPHISPHGVPHGVPPPGIPPHTMPPPHVPPHGIPPPHVPPHGIPPPHSVPPPVVQTSISQGGYDPNAPVPYDPSNMTVPGIQHPPPHPGYTDPRPPHDPNSMPEMIPLPVGPQNVGPPQVGPQSVGPQPVGQGVGPQPVGPQVPPVGTQPLYQQPPPTQHIYAPQQPVDPQGVTQPQYHQVHPAQNPYMQPAPLPPKWKSARDSEGRVYYYHVKTRVSQWEPPQWTPVDQQPESESSSETSEEDDDDDEEDDSSTTEEEEDGEQEEKAEEDEEEDEEEDGGEDKEDREETETKESEGTSKMDSMASSNLEETRIGTEEGSSRIVSEEPKKKERRREGLVQERIISPRREEDRTDSKKYKEIKEKLRRKKEQLRARERAERSKKRHHRDSKQHSNSKFSEKPVTVAADTSSDAARKIKDQFRLQMAGVIVQNLNPYRKPDCKVGRIANTEDFKHLARKLTHFVMVKELKHCRSVEDLECNDNVKHKARDFVKKYMAKYGTVYQRPKDDD